MSSIGDLVVNLSANTQKFDKNINKSKTTLKDFSGSAMSLLNPVTAGLAAMAAGAVAVGASLWGLSSRIGTLAGVADKAAQTGLSGKFLQQLEFAADQSGVSAETLTGGIKKLIVMIGKAGSGSKEAAEALASVGLSAQDLQNLSPEKQFAKVAEAISNIPTAAGKAAAAVKIFGKSGIEMTGLFSGGMSDLNKLMQEAQDIGIGLSDKNFKEIAAADDAIQKMKASFGALVDQIAVGLAPAFLAASTEITNMIGPVTKLFEKFNQLDDRLLFLGDLVSASFDVAMETIKTHWRQMWDEMIAEAAKTVVRINNLMDPLQAGAELGQMAWEAGQAANGNGMQAGAGNLEAAQARLAGLIDKLNNAGNGAENQGPAPRRGANRIIAEPNDMEKAANWFAGAIEKAKPFAALAFDVGKNIVSTVTDPFSTAPEAAKKTEPRLAGAMQRGGSEAYSAIVQAMMRTKDPVVMATEKQTTAIVKAIRESKPTANRYLAAFDGAAAP